MSSNKSAEAEKSQAEGRFRTLLRSSGRGQTHARRLGIARLRLVKAFGWNGVSKTTRGDGRLRDVFGSSALRAAILPFAGLASILSLRLVAESSGSVGFGFFSIITSLPALIPVSDFGISAVVTDNIAQHGIRSWQFRTAWRQTQRLLWLIAGFTALAGIAVGISGSWGLLLGVSDSGSVEAAATYVVVVMALGIPLGAGQRVLLGVGRQALATGLLSASPVVSLGLTAATFYLSPHSNFSLLAIAYSTGTILTQLAVMVVAQRHIKRDGEQSHSRPRTTIAIGHTALPMAVIAITMPLTYQSDRVLLAHVSSSVTVAQYALVAVLFFPLLSIIGFGQQPLWPLFMSVATDRNRLRHLYQRSMVGFVILGVILGCGLALAGPAVSGFIDPHARSPVGLYWAFAALLLMFALNSPSGMLLMDTTGRRIQAAGSVLMLLSKLTLTLLWARPWGAEGAVWATLISAMTFMVIPSLIVAGYRLRKLASE